MVEYGIGVGDGLLVMVVISLREAVELVVERGRRYLCLNMCDAEREGRSFPYYMQKETKLVCFFFLEYAVKSQEQSLSRMGRRLL